MELIDQKTKKVMQECQVRAAEVGLKIEGETLEYIATNQDMLELRPKGMIPTLYDFWVDDLEVLSNKWVYKVYPHNAYETVVNTHPPISFYNDNNPDWLNIMIFDHVLGHIDFFQNNVFFRNTWGRDFCGEALADKRLMERIREEKGAEKRWVDYVIEFARGIDNLVGYYRELGEDDRVQAEGLLGNFSEKVNFYFGDFLRFRYEEKMVTLKLYHEELERLNRCLKEFGDKQGEMVFFEDSFFKSRFPEFNSAFKKSRDKNKNKKSKKSTDLFQYLTEHSRFINEEENKWMKEVLDVVRRTSLHFQPHFRTHNCNEGWASLWHERLYITDPRISSHEVGFARVNSGVVVDPKIGFNPYIGFKRLYEFLEEMSDKGKLSRDYQLIKDIKERERFDRQPEEGFGKKVLFEARRNFDDAMLVNFLSDDDFQDFVDRYNLFIVGRRYNPTEYVIEHYIKSRSGKEYRKMMNDRLYHPPCVLVNEEKADNTNELYLDHVFEGRTLVTKHVPTVLKGLSYLWGGVVCLETTEFEWDPEDNNEKLFDPEHEVEYRKIRILYTTDGKTMERKELEKE